MKPESSVAHLMVSLKFWSSRITARGEVEGLSIVWARKEGVAGRNGARQINGFSITKRKQKKFELMTRPSVHHRHRRLHLEPLVVRCLTDPVVNSLLVKSEKNEIEVISYFLPITIFRLLWQTHCTMHSGLRKSFQREWKTATISRP